MKNNNIVTIQDIERRSRVTKIILAVVGIIAAIAAAFVIGLSGSNSKSWKYYDKYLNTGEKIYNPVEDPNILNYDLALLPSIEYFENAEEPTEGLLRLFESTRSKIRDAFSGLSGLNWSRFDSTTLKVCQRDYVDMANKYGFAEYYEPDNTVYVYGAFQRTSGNEIFLTHELIHALVTAHDSCHTILHEALVEYMAHQVVTDDKVAYEPAVGFVALYAGKHDLQDTVDTFKTDVAQEKMSSLVKDRDRVFQNLELTLKYASSLGFEDSREAYVIYDVMSHFCRAIDGDADMVRLLMAREGIYNEPELANYCEAVLTGKR